MPLEDSKITYKNSDLIINELSSEESDENDIGTAGTASNRSNSRIETRKEDCLDQMKICRDL